MFGGVTRPALLALVVLLLLVAGAYWFRYEHLSSLNNAQFFWDHWTHRVCVSAGFHWVCFPSDSTRP